MKKQQVHIDNISLSDCEIKVISLNDDAHEINIIAKNAIRISDLHRFDETQITIKNWTNLRLSKYVSTGAFAEGKYYEIDWKSKIEVFDSIEEIVLKGESTLLLNGYVKDDVGWFTYEFFEFECEIFVT